MRAATGAAVSVSVLASREAILLHEPPSTSGPGHHPFKVAARVRIPLGASSTVRHAWAELGLLPRLPSVSCRASLSSSSMSSYCSSGSRRRLLEGQVRLEQGRVGGLGHRLAATGQDEEIRAAIVGVRRSRRTRRRSTRRWMLSRSVVAGTPDAKRDASRAHRSVVAYMRQERQEESRYADRHSTAPSTIWPT